MSGPAAGATVAAMSSLIRRSSDRNAVRVFAEIAGAVALWRRRARERRLIAALSHEQLKDMGLSRADAWREAQKPFWRE